MNPNPTQIRRFRKKLLTWFKHHGRDLPWRTDISPYTVFISEIMLQQTQVDRVVAKYSPFIAAFPDFKALAMAPLSKIYSFWQGLGYNRRALNLKKAAEALIKDHSGKLPDVPERLLELPGIGKATAASMCAFAFNKPVVFLETNIRTVLIHHFCPHRTSVTDDDLLPLAAAVLDRRNSRVWYSALMDYGTMLKKQYGNASRRSATYKKQSKFNGSTRQIRGTILRVLLSAGPLKVDEIHHDLSCDHTLLQKILLDLVNEGFLKKKSGKYYLIS
jgi:A/G-specific adenine glycosylase